MESQNYAELQVSAGSFKWLVQKEHTYRSLAEDATTELRKELRRVRARRRDDQWRPENISHSLISQLANGVTRCTHPDRAYAIERALGRERELFALRMSNVSQDVRR